MIETIFSKKCSNCLKRTVVTRTIPSWNCANCGAVLRHSLKEKLIYILICLIGVSYVTFTHSQYIYRLEIFIAILLCFLNRYYSRAIVVNVKKANRL